MPTTEVDAPATGPKALLVAVVGGALISLFFVVVLVGMTGQFGLWAKGIRLAPPAAGSPSYGLVRLASAVAVTVGVLMAPLQWRPRSTRAHQLAGLVLGGLTVVAALERPDLSLLTLAALPAVVVLLLLAALSIRARVQEPLRKEGDLSHLWTSLVLAAGYALVVTSVAVLA